MDTSSITNTQSSGFRSQDSSLSSQEVISGYEPPPHLQNTKPGMASDQSVETIVGNSAGKQRNMGYVPGNGVHKDSISYPGRQNPILASSGRSSEPIHKLDTTAGQKRTANGEVKSESSVSPVNRLNIPQTLNTSPQRSPQRSPQIGHLTDKLRTRLTYAMVKVQHGWESKSINELENLAAQQSSPRSTDQESRLTLSPQRKLASSPERPGTRGTLSPNALGLRRQSPDATSTSSGTSDIGSIRQPLMPNKSHKPTLAPPVDLGPRHSRRSNPPTFAMPAMVSKTNSNLSDSSITSARPQITRTPPIHDTAKANINSQKPSLAMEQDAIETLLFMSSPGNTQHRPSSQKQSMSPNLESNTLPKKSKLSIPVMLAHVANTDTIPVSPRKKLIIEDIDLGDDQNIDQVLDQMPADQGEEDTSSDEDMTTT